MRMRANWNTLTLPVSVYICTITLGKCVMISPKAKPTHAYTLWPTFGRVPKISDVHQQNVHSSFFGIGPNGEQPKCPSTVEWINQFWNIIIIEYYTMKKNKLPKHTWINFTDIMLNERNWTKKGTCYMTPRIWISKISKANLWRRGQNTGSLVGIWLKGSRRSFPGHWKCSTLDLGGGYMGVHITENSSHCIVKMCSR